jgi:hypothetical protein
MSALLILALLASDTTYWQQRVAYGIAASLDEPSGVLSGNVTIHYVNQSPDTLRDFYVHQYLNAFRPGSRWAAVDAAEQRVRFQHMKDPDYAFERISESRMMGQANAPDYPYAPDSTIAHWRLPRPLAPGDSMQVEIRWQARPSTLARRQGRQGRRFDFAQWYPKVVVYDRYGWEDHPLYPAGEFYGEFASYDVTLDLAADQVIGATGVAVEGDPGWQKALVGGGTIDYQRDWYGPFAHRPISPSSCTAAAGRKCVRFYADSEYRAAGLRWQERIKLLMPFQVNEKLMKASGNAHVRFMHCLPAFHDTETVVGKQIAKDYGIKDGVEVTNDVFESEANVAFEQAENRLHTIKALLVATLGD